LQQIGWRACCRPKEPRGQLLEQFGRGSVNPNDIFGVPEDTLEKYGAFNVAVVVDLPLFIDPFLLFNSKDAKYQTLHNQMIHDDV
jgi:hypothetical protein